ncbi:MAG: DUF6941 family protein [Phycisphaerae bacterium]
MPKTRLILACRQVIVDTFSNAACAINIFDSFTVAGVPVAFPGLMVLAVIEKHEEDADSIAANIAVRLNGRLLVISPGSVNFAGQRMARVIADLGNLVIDAPGELRFSVESNDTTLGEYVVAVGVTSPTLFDQKVVAEGPIAGQN